MIRINGRTGKLSLLSQIRAGNDETEKQNNLDVFIFCVRVSGCVSACMHVYVERESQRDRTQREKQPEDGKGTHRVYFGVFVVLIAAPLAHC